MAKHLLARGFAVAGYDPRETARRNAASLGVSIHESPREVASASELVIIVVGISSLNVVKEAITIVGNANAATTVVFNVGSGDFVWNGATIVLSGGITPAQILWNFPTTTGLEITISTPAASFAGTILSPYRGVSLDKSTMDGAILGGAVALLYAPKSGKETRNLINRKTGEGKEVLDKTSKELYEKGREFYDRGKQIADDAADLFERGRRLVRG